MIKRYIAVRVFVMLDIVGLSLYTVALVNGWPIIHTLAYPSAIVWGALSLPLAGLFVWSVYHRLALIQNKHKHEQYIIQQRDLMQLEAERQNLLPPYPSAIVEGKNTGAKISLQGSQPIAKIAGANFAGDDAKIASDIAEIATDELDEQILDAMQELIAQHKKPTGIAVSDMTGIPQRTVYDRMAKLKQY